MCRLRRNVRVSGLRLSHVGQSRSPARAVRAVEERLNTLDQETLAAFCAALWRARGYDVRREGARLRATRGDERLRILVRAAHGPLRVRTTLRSLLPSGVAGDAAGDERRETDIDVDVVVTPVDARWARRLADRHDARHVGSTALANCLLYAIPRSDADALTTRYLGVPMSSVLGTSGTRTPTFRPTRSSTTGLVVAGVVCLVLAAVVGGVWTPAGSGFGAVDDGATAQTSPTSQSGAVANRTVSSAEQYPPGVSTGSVDARVLADAHAAAIAGRSYRLITRQSGTDTLDGSRRWSGAWQHAVVADNRTWLYAVVGYDDTPNGTRLVQYTAYADGKDVYRRADVNEGPRYDRSPARVTTDDGDGFHTDRARRAIQLYLTATRVEVDRPSWRPDLFRVVATGQPTAVDGVVSNYTATAFVSREGFVSELTVEFTRHEGGNADEVRFRLEYAAVDETEVNPPGWYDEARAATATNGTDTLTPTNATDD
jgi:hypothetical protein